MLQYWIHFYQLLHYQGCLLPFFKMFAQFRVNFEHLISTISDPLYLLLMTASTDATKPQSSTKNFSENTISLKPLTGMVGTIGFEPMTL